MTTRTTRFYEDREISAHRGYTNEGFMICSDVAIARVGKYLYPPVKFLADDVTPDPTYTQPAIGEIA